MYRIHKRMLELATVTIVVAALYKLLKGMDKEEEIYRIEYKQFLDDDTYFKMKYEESDL